MNEKRKEAFGGSDDRFSELGQQVGAVLGQVFAAAEQFGQQVTKDSQAWSESRGATEPSSQEPLASASALWQAGEEFRATASRAAENLTQSLRDADAPAASYESDAGVPVAEVQDAEVQEGKLQEADVREATVQEESENTAQRDITPGNVRKIGGGGAVEPDARSRASTSVDQPQAGLEEKRSEDRRIARAEQLAEIFRNDASLSQLTQDDFDALKKLLENQYRSIREFQGSKG